MNSFPIYDWNLSVMILQLNDNCKNDFKIQAMEVFFENWSHAWFRDGRSTSHSFSAEPTSAARTDSARRKSARTSCASKRARPSFYSPLNWNWFNWAVISNSFLDFLWIASKSLCIPRALFMHHLSFSSSIASTSQASSYHPFRTSLEFNFLSTQFQTKKILFAYIWFWS